MGRGRIVIVGGGIIGLAHALTALEADWSVTVLERDGRPLGASVRNFGTLWPIGCTFGPEREQALYGVKRWQELSAGGSFWMRRCGSVSLAYREEAWAILQEFKNCNPPGEGFELLEPAEVAQRFPAANLLKLQGALYSAAETVVHPPSAIAALLRKVADFGGTVHFNKPVVKVHGDAVETSDGLRFEFDHLVIAAGEEIRLLFPRELSAAQLTCCRLQMMRTVPQPGGFDLNAIFVSDLTLGHYPAFRNCPSTAKLRLRLDEELPQFKKWGVHVIAAQHPDGSLVLGDSHEYGSDLDPEGRTEVDELILEELQRFVHIPDLRIAARWLGVYLKSTVGQTQVVLQPRERVTMVTAMGGLGLTLSWGLARKTVQSWSQAAV